MKRLAGFVAILMLSAAPRWLQSQSTNAGQPLGRVRVPVLVYHNVAPRLDGESRRQRELNVDPREFESHMQALRAEGYTVISLRALEKALAGGAPVPARSVVITFDDGWKSQFEHAFPVLRRMGFTATFFVFTSPIGRDARFMTWAELREMQAAGMSVGSHSRTHPYLSRSTALTAELTGSRAAIERQLGTAPEFFAYPFGEKGARLTTAVRDAGYLGARGFGGGAWNSRDDLWNLHSIPVTADLAAFTRLLRPADKSSRSRRPKATR
jgi:peptidoglycan/xylan/chitin deacetylase (PgdA/CDA1 family)